MKTIQYQIRGHLEVWNDETGQATQNECVSSVKTVCKTQGEFDAVYPQIEIAAIPGSIIVTGDFFEEPTQLDRVEAQATYTAMMTDTLLEV